MKTHRRSILLIVESSARMSRAYDARQERQRIAGYRPARPIEPNERKPFDREEYTSHRAAWFPRHTWKLKNRFEGNEDLQMMGG